MLLIILPKIFERSFSCYKNDLTIRPLLFKNVKTNTQQCYNVSLFLVEISNLKTGGKVAGFRAGSGVSKFGLISDN